MSEGITKWANAALDMRNFTILVLDTTGVERNSDIIRLLTIDRHGNVDQDLVMCSGRNQSANTQYTHIEQSEMEEALPLEAMWPDVRAAIRGNYIVTYGLRFAQARLDENAAHYGLAPVYILGADLLDQATGYFSATRFVKLADACRYIGHPLPDRPDALERAKAALELVKRMAAGRYLPLAAPPAPGGKITTTYDNERPF